MKVLVTGGAGYIGSHTCVELLQAGYELVVVDNLSNSHREALSRVESISAKTLTFVKADIRDRAAMDQVFAEHAPEGVIHFAGLKAVGESTRDPLAYYDHNVNGSRLLLELMQKHGVKTLVFSSSATVYGDPDIVPIDEGAPLRTTNPYGQTKLVVESMCRDVVAADPTLSVVLLRYFNPVGAHSSGLIGEDPSGIPNNLVPYIAQVAVGKRERLSVFGNDYDTRDGTGVRDYIHVVDLASGHVKALEALHGKPGCHTFNLGTGRGYSVLEMVNAFSKACGRAVPYEFAPRRPGDIAVCYAKPGLAERVLGWRASLGLDDMMADTWRWQSQNPDGYASGSE
ncbi:UDP-glucose 4-epimerase GalE [Pseudoalteromonas sp. T1lg75]|uniref:UDP-glucose 4-epimerase GalE n=1 Tax=Pseudoalteromonas sp. T1lg75 TaxID=2077102 RepID=UPI000CF63494|nr:UDP-glucose 4-epimerase GalE [Pseudoalteromonas sp. T1lg75]